jgi:hypothetical protein
MGNPTNMPSDTKNSKPFHAEIEILLKVSHGEPHKCYFFIPQMCPIQLDDGPGLPALQPWKHFVPVKEDFSSLEDFQVLLEISGWDQPIGWGVNF